MGGETGEWRAGYRRRLRPALQPIVTARVTELRSAGMDDAEVCRSIRRELRASLAEVVSEMKAGKWGGQPSRAVLVPRIAREVVEELLSAEGL